MYNSNNEYINATKDARINRDDDDSVSVRLWVVNFTLFSVLTIGSYYAYLHFNKEKKYSTVVMGVTHTNTADNNLMKKLYDIEVEQITVERENISISTAMKKVIEESDTINSSKYLEELALELNSGSKRTNLAFEKIVSDELKLLN